MTKLEYRVDTNALLNEIATCTTEAGILKIPLNIFKSLLAQTAQRATELNDPKLNILMLKLALYEVEPDKINEKIDEQLKLIEKK